MKILLITKTLSLDDGQGRYSREIINQLKNEYQLIILTSDLADFKPVDVEIHKIPSFYILNNLFLNFFYSLKLFKFTERVDFIHFLSDFPYCILFGFHKLKKPFFITAHGTYAVDPLEKICSGHFLKGAYKRAKKIFCVSEFTKNEILKRIKLNNLIAINNGVNYQNWQIDYKPVKMSYRKILSVGALKSRKGYHISIPAMAKVKESYQNLKYYIVGSQEDKKCFQELKDLVRQYHLENNIIFLEKISDEELIKLYYQADLFLLTPVNVGSKFEGFGLVYLEAGACGIPAIGTYGCGAEEAIKDGYNGLLVSQNNIEETAQAILKILADENLAKKLGENGKERAQEFSWEKIIKKYEVIYPHT